MLTLEQYREPQMAQLYQNYLASGPLTYIEALFSGMLGDAGKARQTALDFYGPMLDMMVNGGKRVSLQNLKTVTEWYISLN